MTTNAIRSARRAGVSLAAAAGLIAALAACTQGSVSLADGERPGTASVGTADACPGEYLQSLANARTVAGAAVKVNETDDDSLFEAFSPAELLCVAQLDGNRKLPSGAGEPTEFIGLYAGNLTDAITKEAEAAGFAVSDHTGTEVFRKDDTLLSLQVKSAERLGIEGEGEYTLVHQMQSEELADIRAPR